MSRTAGRPAPRVTVAATAALAALLASVVAPAAQAADRVCGWPQALPSAQLCRGDVLSSSAASAPGASAAEASAAAQNDPVAALLARADALRHADDLPAAQRALICAAAQPGAADDLRRRYEVVRRLGIVDYALARPVEALARFECALGMARELEDRAEIARQLKNVGSSLRRIGDYAGAMRALVASLDMQRQAGDTAVGPALNNIADVYREMEQREDAERYYREALAAFRAGGDVVQAMHVYDSLADLAIDRRDTRAATALLEEALQDLRAEAEGGDGEAGALRYQLLIRAGLIRAALTAGDTAAARGHLADALALADTHRLALPPQLQLEAARTERLSGRGEDAVARLRRAVAASEDAPAQQALLLRELSQALQAGGRDAEALEALRRAYAREIDDLRAQRDRDLAWSNARFNLNESRRQLAEAEARSQRRTLQLWLTAISALAALALLALVFQRRHQRARQADAVRRARYEEALAHYRREYDALAEDRHLLQALLDSREDALVLSDGDGVVLALNRAACALLSADSERIVGTALADSFAADSADALRDALERMEDAGGLRLRLRSADERPPLQADLRQWERGDGKIVIALSGLADAGEGSARDAVSMQAVREAMGDAGIHPVPDPDARPAPGRDSLAMPQAGHSGLDPRGPTDAGIGIGAGPAREPAREPDVDADPDVALETSAGADADPDDDADTQRQRFRRELVELMLALVEAWERSTGHNRIELAERSRIWRVNIDDGRLRARAMERYLSLSKLPRNPRWRDVLRSAYFVLSHCETLAQSSRDELQARVDRIIETTRRQALAETVQDVAPGRSEV